MQTSCDIKYGNLNINNVKVSPLGVTLTGSSEINKTTKIPISVKMTDGSVQELESAMCCGDNGEVRLKYLSDLPLDTSKVESVVVNGTSIKFDLPNS